MEKIIEPSLLALDRTKARTELEKIKDLKLKYVHYDVMDEQFIGHKALMGEYLDILEDLKILPNVHLMVADPKKYIDMFKNYKVNSITFHVETQDINKASNLLDYIHSLGFKAGIAIKMETDLNNYLELANKCDFILIMAVAPGLGGQRYSLACQRNLQAAKTMKQLNPDIRVQLDGGVDDKIIAQDYDLVDNFITGSWFFRNIDNIKPFLSEFNKQKKVG